MSHYTDRTGQRIGTLEILADHGRTKHGQVIWRAVDHATGRERYLKTYEIIRLDRARIVSSER